eukprot:scaffold61714_cov44-Phaeocystis_antarctica.AAC.1
MRVDAQAPPLRLFKKTPTATPEPASDIPPNITPHVRPSEQPPPAPLTRRGGDKYPPLSGQHVSALTRDGSTFSYCISFSRNDDAP